MENLKKWLKLHIDDVFFNIQPSEFTEDYELVNIDQDIHNKDEAKKICSELNKLLSDLRDSQKKDVCDHDKYLVYKDGRDVMICRKCQETW